MNFEPQKFFIGLVGFFSIIMPGALLTYLGKDWFATNFLTRPDFPLAGPEEWLVFLFVSYLLGHFAFLVGSLLDDLIYKPVRDSTYAGQIRLLASGKPLSHPWLRRLARSPLGFSGDPDAALLLAQRIRSAALTPLGAAGAVNAYQWCKARLSKDHPEGLLSVERFEADSKFFRSFAVVLFLLLLVLLGNFRPAAALLCALLVVPALWRYMDLRFKATQQAYWYVIMLEGERAKSVSPTEAGSMLATPAREDGLTHAGGVVFRGSSTAPEYLLVEATGGKGDWVLPKGHIEPFEDPRETAVREIAEEAGVWSRLVQRINDIDLLVAGRSLYVRFYLLEAIVGEEAPPGDRRRLRWLTLPEAIAAGTHEETRILLKQAEQLRAARTGL